ncbi:LOG family protein [Nocardia sp. CC201C]|uniref:SLOG cluster 4 domain-containing protein n=1 Tax=Nocardia sp. CC201C TaxID=3044575 RepID=UPI0024A9E839|nr:LOG family protein [Nocardia sp. CC201C]
MTTVTFFGGVRAEDDADRVLAYEIGCAIGQAGATIQHGGYNGLMEAAARGAATTGGRIVAVTLENTKWGEFNPHVTHAIHLPRLGDRLHRFLDTTDLVIAMGGGIGTLHELSAALWYASNIRPVPVWLVGSTATHLAAFLRKEQWLYETPTRPMGFLREITHIEAFRCAFDDLVTRTRSRSGDSELADRIRQSALRRGRHRLADGEVIEEYFDQYSLAADPELLRDVTTAMAQMVPADTDIVAGLELGGVPLAAAISINIGASLACIRRAAKPYGTGRRIEGGVLTERDITIVDDVARTGSQLLEAATALRDIGARVTTAVCIVDRNLDARLRLADHGIRLRTLVVEPVATPARTTPARRA